MSQAAAHVDEYPGQTLGLPETGRGSLAPWGNRLWALVIDWAACMIVARAIFGPAVNSGVHWQMFMPMTLFFVEKAVLTALTSGSFGQLICRLAVVRLDGEQIGWARSLARAAMKLIIVPAVVIGAERRALDDLALGTVVVNRR